MSKDKLEDDAKKIVRKKTDQTKRSDAWRKKPGKPGGFRDLFEDMWSDLENPQDSKKDAAGRKGTFRSYQTPEPQPWGAVTRRAVAQRRSRASGLTRRSA